MCVCVCVFVCFLTLRVPVYICAILRWVARVACYEYKCIQVHTKASAFYFLAAAEYSEFGVQIQYK